MTATTIARFSRSRYLFTLMAICVASCSTTVILPDSSSPVSGPSSGFSRPLPASSARWLATDWSALPGLEADNLDEAWTAWLASCLRPKPVWQPLCPQVRALTTEPVARKRAWMMQHLQPYQLLDFGGASSGKLTSYYEPIFEASRVPSEEFAYPIYSPPASMSKPWHERSTIEASRPSSLPQLIGRDWAYLRSPVDVLNLHIQGSALLMLRSPNGTVSPVRAAFADTNGHRFRSPFQWLIQSGELRNPNWQSVQTWVNKAAPQRVQEMMNYNPRYIFFREEAIASSTIILGPKGAEGVALTPGRSIAVDPKSLPYGTPVWIASSGPAANLNRLVLAQDTGSAIVGAIRADYFAGTGDQAGLFAQRVNQPLQMWALWPK